MENVVSVSAPTPGELSTFELQQIINITSSSHLLSRDVNSSWNEMKLYLFIEKNKLHSVSVASASLKHDITSCPEAGRPNKQNKILDILK